MVITSRITKLGKKASRISFYLIVTFAAAAAASVTAMFPVAHETTQLVW